MSGLVVRKIQETMSFLPQLSALREAGIVRFNMYEDLTVPEGCQFVQEYAVPVSYTHLTLPTSDLV